MGRGLVGSDLGWLELPNLIIELAPPDSVSLSGIEPGVGGPATVDLVA